MEVMNSMLHLILGMKRMRAFVVTECVIFIHIHSTVSHSMCSLDLNPVCRIEKEINLLTICVNFDAIQPVGSLPTILSVSLHGPRHVQKTSMGIFGKRCRGA